MSDKPNNAVPIKRIAFLGPAGTFAEEALRTLEGMGEPAPAHVPMRTMPEVLQAVQAGEVDYGFVALENSIEGTVNISLDSLIFDTDLLIQREVILGIRLSLVAPRGVKLKDIKRVVSFPVASAQCRDFLVAQLPGVEVVAANSTAEAARQVSRSSSKNTAALGTALAAQIYGLNVLVPDVSDRDENQTRFVLVAKRGVPARTGHDKTSIVCFQSADKPGNLHAILGQFSARSINLTKLESRPTKDHLGDYCFIIDLEGHIDEEVVADCLRDLHVQLRALKFLGSYPATGPQAPKRRRDALAAWRQADLWLAGIRDQVEPGRRRLRSVK